MGSRGRTSAAALAIPATTQVIDIPDAPYDLTDEQAEVWHSQARAIILEGRELPVRTYPVLTEICRHVVKSRRIAELVESHEKSPDFDVKEYDRLLKMAERESRGISSHSTKLRAILGERAPKSKTPKPWQK